MDSTEPLLKEVRLRQYDSVFLHQRNGRVAEGKNAEIIEGTLNTTNIVTQTGLTVCDFSASDYLAYHITSEDRKRTVSFTGHGWGMHAGKLVDNKPEKPLEEWYSKTVIIPLH